MHSISKEIPIIYEDNHLIVVEKPVNIPTQGDDSGDLDMLTLLKADLKERYQKPGNVFLGLVHRLDRPVGGVMVFAKTSKAASRLSESIRSRQFQKKYLAVVHGQPAKPENRLVHHLLKDHRTNMVSVVDRTTPEAKEAILDYTYLASENGLSLLSIHLQTGRAHQIRVQLAKIGCPLFGDQKYGATLNKKGQQIALWAAELSFAHPTAKEQLTFHSKPPQLFPWNAFRI